MTSLKRLLGGDLPLWRVFWLIGLPLVLVWDLTGACMVFGIGVQSLLLAGLIIGLFTLATLAIPLVSIGLWRSATNFPRKEWWHTPAAWAAKACAVFSGVTSSLSIVGLIYLGYDIAGAFF